MRSYSANQQAVINSESLEGLFLFEVYFSDSSSSSPSYRWAMEDVVYNGESYTGKILSHSGMNWDLGTIELRKINPSIMKIQIAFSNSQLDGLYASDFENAYVKVRAIGKIIGGAYQELVVIKYKIVSSISINQIMTWEMQDPFTLCLEGIAPSTPLIDDIFPLSATRHDNICVPESIYGVAWILLRWTAKNFDAVKVDENTFTVVGNHTDTFVAGLAMVANGSVNCWVDNSSYASGLTTVNTTTSVIPNGLYSILIDFYVLGTDEGQTYTIYQARSPKEQSKVSNYFLANYTFLQLKVQAQDDNWYQCVCLQAIDTDGDGLYDSNIHWGVIGKEIYDVPFRVSRSDLINITSPSDVIVDQLKKYGMGTDDIDSITQASVRSTFETRGVQFQFGLWYQCSRMDLIASLFSAANMYPIIRDTLGFKLFTPTPVYTLEETYVEPGSVNISKAQIRADQVNSGYVLWLSENQMPDQPFKSLVAAKSLDTLPSSLTVDCTYITTSDSSTVDSETALRSGKWVIQRSVLTDKSFSCSCLAQVLGVEIGDLIRINSSNLGKENGNFDILILRISLQPGFKIGWEGISFRSNIDDWNNLSVVAKIAADVSSITKGISPVSQGLDSGEGENRITERIRVAPGGDILLEGEEDDPALVKWKGSTYEVQAGFNAVGNVFSIQAGSDGDVNLIIGDDWKGGFNSRFHSSTMHLTGYFIVYLSFMSYQFQSNYFGIDNHKTTDCGDSSYAWDDIYADDFQNVADFFLLDSKNDLEVINKIKGSGKIDSRTGLELIDDDSFPEWLLTKCKKTGKILYDPDGKPYLSIKTMLSLLLGAIRELSKKINNGEK